MTLTMFLQRPALTAAASSLGRCGLRSLSTSPFYSPTLVELRPGERGRGGRGSEAAKKVAVFGAGGLLGGYVCSELGKLKNSKLLKSL